MVRPGPAHRVPVRPPHPRPGQRKLAFQPTKTTYSQRRILLPTACVRSLKHYRTRQNLDRRTAGPGWRDLDLVFATTTGGPLDPVTVYRTHRTICELARVRHIRFHDLRHTCATLLLEEGVELVTIKELLGHAQLHITADIYAHVRPRLKRNAIEAMDRTLQADEDDDDEADTDDDAARTSDDERPATEP